MVRATDSLKQNGFTTYAVEPNDAPTQYQGRDAYYKILFISGIGEIEYDDAIYHIDGPVLLFTNPAVTCRWSLSKAHHATYICALNNDILTSACLNWSENGKFYFKSAPVFHLSSEKADFVRAIFCRMVEEQKSLYSFKEELIQNQLCVLKHMAFQMIVARKSVYSSVCAIPLSAVSLELVELGFPLVAQALHFN
jgi:AraC family transcriptional regulator, transcriptional activator of pobA